MRRLETEWDSYRAAVVPKDAGAVQVEETRRSFYAGAAALHYLVMEMLSPGDETTDEDLKNMQDIHDELISFGASVDPRPAN
jgi:hypothetical protein